MIDNLRTFLATLPPGPIPDATELERLLAACWHELAANHGGMEGRKLLGRMEDVAWNPPLLTFTIERHGGTVMGSTRATLQEWTVNVEASTAHRIEARSRQVRPMKGRLDVRPLADEIAQLIVSRKKDERLRWADDGSVRVLIGKVLPEGSAVKETLAGRRKRFRAALRERLVMVKWQECEFHSKVAIFARAGTTAL
jgi:hypothetical protein